METFTHTNEKGEANMVDINNKPNQIRIAKASGFIILEKKTIKLIIENTIKKGDVLTIAKIAAIQGAKKTSELIPLCHQLLISKIDIETEVLSDRIKVLSTVKCSGKTGVEMEALLAVNIGLLTIYDMCKAVDKRMTISEVKLDSKIKTNY